MSYLMNAAVFLIDLVFGLYALIVLVRFLLQLVRADFYNPVSQLVVKATNLPLKPLRRFIPGYGGIDFASLALLLIVKMLEIILIGLFIKAGISIVALLPLAIMESLRLVVLFYIFAIIITVVLSWLAPGNYNPAVVLLHQLTEPVLRPFRKMLPPMSGLDVSPLLAGVALVLVMLLIIAPLVDGVCTIDLFSSSYCRARGFV